MKWHEDTGKVIFGLAARFMRSVHKKPFSGRIICARTQNEIIYFEEKKSEWK